MCNNPLKGFLYDSKVVKVGRDAKYIKLEQGEWRLYYNEPAESDYKEYIDLPCRKCTECLLSNKRDWTNRAVAESMLHSSMIFITLTYNDDSIRYTDIVNKDTGVVHSAGMLEHNDVQLFIKRLRSSYKEKKLRYMVAGEYGGKTKRPHYHMILYELLS